MGLVITKVHSFMQFTPNRAFEHLAREVADARRLADVSDDDAKVKGELFKLLGNSYYGRLLMDVNKHEDISYCTEKDLGKYLRSPLFKKADEIGETGVFEVHMGKQKVVHDLPITIPFFVYQYSKLHMLRFYNFLHQCLGPENFQLLEMDTDSLYFSLSTDTLDEAVLPDQRDYFDAHKHLFLFEPTNTYNKRTPGLFKVEWEGEGMMALNSKTYYAWGRDNNKISTKGLSKKLNSFDETHFDRVLTTKKKEGGINRGFVVKDSQVLLYQQTRDGLSYFYPKRQVLDDGISTVPLLI